MTAVFAQSSFAQQEAIIFEVKKNLALRDSDKIVKDYLISQGTEAGLQPGAVVTVTRRISIYDNYQNRTAGDMLVPVGEVQIIFAQKGLAVARLVSIYDRRNLPTVDFEAVMIGDRVDLRSIRKGKVSASDFESSEDTLQVRKPKEQTTAAVTVTTEVVDLNSAVKPLQVKQEEQAPQNKAELSSLSNTSVTSPN